MKRFLVILTMFLTIGTLAMAQAKQFQPQPFVQGGVGTSNEVFSQTFEIGATTGQNRLSLVGETFSEDEDEREWFAGIGYTRVVPVGKVFDFLMQARALVHVDNDFALSLEPGVAAGWKISDGVAFIASLTSPIYQNTKVFSPIQLKAGVGVKVNL